MPKKPWYSIFWTPARHRRFAEAHLLEMEQQATIRAKLAEIRRDIADLTTKAEATLQRLDRTEAARAANMTEYPNGDAPRRGYQPTPPPSQVPPPSRVTRQPSSVEPARFSAPPAPAAPATPPADNTAAIVTAVLVSNYLSSGSGDSGSGYGSSYSDSGGSGSSYSDSGSSSSSFD